MASHDRLTIRRALITVSDKSGVIELAQALAAAGAELVATGRTASVLKDSGLKVTPIEQVSGSPEAFQGRMKTLSFPVCSGILYRRGDKSDETDLERLRIQPIDCVVVNFYPFEQAATKLEAAGKEARGEGRKVLPGESRKALSGESRKALVEEIDIGGPTLVRAAAKNAPDTLVLTDPAQYAQVIGELKRERAVSRETALRCASQAWERIWRYDSAIHATLGPEAQASGGGRLAVEGGSAPAESGHALALRYGENPHQSGSLSYDPDGPIAWQERLTATELSYNNILDLSAAYGLAGDLLEIAPSNTGVVIVKHNNPCGVASVPKLAPRAQRLALEKAWEGDPISAFGGVLVFTDPLTDETAAWLAERFVELAAAPELHVDSPALRTLAAKRKNLKAVRIRRFGEHPAETVVTVPGGLLRQAPDRGTTETLRSVTRAPWPESRDRLGRFGIAVCRALKSNAIALVRELPGVEGGLQLVGAGQGQPNRVEALKALAVPRAQAVLQATGGGIGDCVMVSDAFFPFRDTVDAAHAAGIRAIIQPGGSIKDAESVAACDEHGISMVFTGTRHFRH